MKNKLHRGLKFSAVLGAIVILTAACSSASSNSSAAAEDAKAGVSERIIEPPVLERGSGIPSAVLDGLESCQAERRVFLCGELEADDGYPIKFRVSPILDRDNAAGVIAVHFGGPGTSSYDFLPGWSSPSPGEKSFRRFDLVGVEQRGTGSEAGLDCGNDELLDRIYTQPIEIEERAALEEEWVSGCPDTAVGTAQAAKDTAAVLDYLKAERSLFTGYSYGGTVGALLAINHPDSVEGVVLDSPGLDIENPNANLLQAQSFDRAFSKFLEHCDTTLSCEFAPNGNSMEQFVEILNDYEQKNELLTAIVLFLYTDDSYNEVSLIINSAKRGDTEIVSSFADSYYNRENGMYPPSIEIFPIVRCADDLPVGISDADAAREQGINLGTLGSVAIQHAPFASMNFCEAWKGTPEKISLDLSDTDVPVLVVASTNDPAIPWEGLEPIVENGLPEKSGTVLVDDFSHTQWRAGNRCVDDAVDAFIVDGLFPQDPILAC